MPAPLRPMRAMVSPGRTVRSMSRRAWTWARRTERERTSAGCAGTGAAGVRRRSRPAVRTSARFSRGAVSPSAAAGARTVGARPASRSLSSPALRRASRTVSGRGDQPARRPRSTTGGHTGDTAIISAGVPRTGACPRAGRRATWSAYWTTRSRRCSAMRIVVPRSWTSRWRTARTSSAAAGSRAEVGSSRTRTSGCGVRTEPIATRCCWPPESVARGRSRREARPSRSRVSSTRRRITAGGRPNDSIP